MKNDKPLQAILLEYGFYLVLFLFYLLFKIVE